MKNCQEHTSDESIKNLVQARNLFEEGLFQECLDLVTHLIEFHEKEIDYCEALLLNGACLSRHTKYFEGLEYLIKAKEIIKEDKNKLLFLKLTTELGRCFKGLNEFGKAISYFQLGEKYFYLWEYENLDEIILLSILKGQCYIELKDIENAIIVFKDIETKISEFTNENYREEYLSQIYYHLSDIYLFLENTLESEVYLNKIRFEHLSNKFKQEYYKNIILLKNKQKKYYEVIEVFKKYEKFGIRDEMKSFIYSWIGDTYSSLDDDKKANVYFEKSLEYEDTYNCVHEIAKKYLVNYNFGEKKYKILSWFYNLFIVLSIIILYLNFRKDVFDILFNHLTPYHQVLDRLWLIPILISIMISTYLRKWKIIGNKWYSKLGIIQKLLFYSMYIVVLVFIALMEILI